MAKYEYNKFQKTFSAKQIRKNVSFRLGFDLINNSISLDDIDTMSTMCRLDFSWNMKQKSPWCAVIILSSNKLFN